MTEDEARELGEQAFKNGAKCVPYFCENMRKNVILNQDVDHIDRAKLMKAWGAGYFAACDKQAATVEKEHQQQRKNDFREGFLHAITLVQLNSGIDISSVLHYCLSEEDFDEYKDTLEITKGWTEGQLETLKSIWGNADGS